MATTTELLRLLVRVLLLRGRLVNEVVAGVACIPLDQVDHPRQQNTRTFIDLWNILKINNYVEIDTYIRG